MQVAIDKEVVGRGKIKKLGQPPVGFQTICCVYLREVENCGHEFEKKGSVLCPTE